MVEWSTHFFVSGTNPRDVRPVAPRIYSKTTDSSRCLVEAYKKYRAFRPAEMNDPDALFYLAVNWGRQDVIRHKCNALGQKTLYSMLRCMVSAAGIGDDRRLTNHSARKLLIQNLSNLNIDSNHIKQVSGHKSVESITNYAHLNSKQHETISDVFVDPTARGSRDDLHALALPGPSGLANQARSSVLARPASPQRSLALGWQASHSLSSRSEWAGQFVGCTFAGPVTGKLHHKASQVGESYRIWWQSVNWWMCHSGRPRLWRSVLRAQCLLTVQNPSPVSRVGSFRTACYCCYFRRYGHCAVLDLCE